MDPSQKKKYIIAGISLVVIALAVYFLFIFHRGPKEIKSQESTGEVKTLENIDVAKRPYVTLTPTTDGAEIIISIENIAEFDRIEYELTYQADIPGSAGGKIQRGSTGSDVNPKEPIYKKSILLGTASKGVRSPDRGITDGKLTLHLFKGEDEYVTDAPWNMIEANGATILEDAAGNFSLQMPTLSKGYWVIVADTVGLPKDAKVDIKKVVLPNYGVFSIAPDFTKSGKLSIKLQKEAQSPKISAYTHADSKWQDLESTYDSAAKTVSATVSNFATFVVVNQ